MRSLRNDYDHDHDIDFFDFDLLKFDKFNKFNKFNLDNDFTSRIRMGLRDGFLDFLVWQI